MLERAWVRRALCCLPFVWGVLGIFWFDRMLSAASWFIERFFRVDGR